MKVIGLAAEPYGRKRYICEVEHHEIEKFLDLFYNKLPELKVGEVVDLGRGHDYAEQIGTALGTTQKFIEANQKTITAILNGLNIQRIVAERDGQ